MALSTHRILTVSAKDYSEMVGASVHDYELVGIHEQYSARDTIDSRPFIERFADSVPPAAEVVVAYHATGGTVCGMTEVIMSATALIPRSQNRNTTQA